MRALSNLSVAVLLASVCNVLADGVALESARDIPVCQTADVVVVGGSCGAVSAAVAAKKAGASVFLVAPRPYLGEDIAGTMRLWLESGEKPVTEIAKAIWLADDGVPFTYKTSLPSSGRHLDKNQSMLADGLFQNVVSCTVEYADTVKIDVALKELRPLKAVEAVSFSRPGDFEISEAHLVVSSDGKEISKVYQLQPSPEGEDGRVRWHAEIGRQAKTVALRFTKKPGCKRILLAELVFKAADAGEKIALPTPLRVKQVFDSALLTNAVPFLTGSYVTDVLRDGAGAVAGVVIANRSGRQAVLAKAVIDATERAAVARMAGARFTPYPAGQQVFERIVISGDRPEGKGLSVRQLPGDFPVAVSLRRNKSVPEKVDGKAWLCTLSMPMKDGSYSAFANAEQIARDRTFTTNQLDAADTLFQVPPDALESDCPPHLFVLGGCEKVSREEAAKMLRPLAFMTEGERIGRLAAKDALERAQLAGVKRSGAMGKGSPAVGEVREFLNGAHEYAGGLPTIRAEETALPVLGTYDVVVVGGGTSGAPAGIAAGRGGAKTLLVEYLYGLGGVGTLGMIGLYYYGNICGFTAEHDKDVDAIHAAVHVVGKAECWRRENRAAGTEIWFGVMACGAFVRDGRVVGVVVATPAGRGVVLAAEVVDATGNADVAAAAGAPCVFQGAGEIAVQGAGLSPRQLGASYINSDWGYVNDSDASDLWLFGVRGRAGAGQAWDVSQIAETRERRRIVGDECVSPLDAVNERTFPDTVLRTKANFDSHGYSVDDICYVSEPNGKRVYWVNVPYRSLLPKTLEGITAVGLAVSAHRDAMPMIRMQPDLQNMGYVAGVAGAMAAKSGKTFRSIDVRELQKALVKEGNIPAEVLDWKDNARVDPERLATAVKNLGDRYHDIGLVLAQAKEALPALRQAYAAAETPTAKLVYAHVLGILGDATGVETLAAVVSGKEPLLNLNLKDEAAFGRRMPEMDSMIVALGRTRDKRALGPLLDLVRKMDASAPNTRFRSVCLALEAMGNPVAAQPLAVLLRKPGIGGHAMTETAAITPAGGYGNGDEQSVCLRELNLARALYKCGDYEGLARETLLRYTRDIRGIYALHAKAVLKE